MHFGSRLRCGSKQMADKHFEKESKEGRVEFVPVEWRSSLKLDEGEYYTHFSLAIAHVNPPVICPMQGHVCILNHPCPLWSYLHLLQEYLTDYSYSLCIFVLYCIGVIDLVTPHTVRGVRNMINTSMMDIMYYTSPFYREEVFARHSLYILGLQSIFWDSDKLQQFVAPSTIKYAFGFQNKNRYFFRSSLVLKTNSINSTSFSYRGILLSKTTGMFQSLPILLAVS